MYSGFDSLESSPSLLKGPFERAARRHGAQREGEAVVAQALRGLSSTLDKLPAVHVGVCWPGLKTADGRGILVAKNGPRCVDLLAELEAALNGP